MYHFSCYKKPWNFSAAGELHEHSARSSARTGQKVKARRDGQGRLGETRPRRSGQAHKLHSNWSRLQVWIQLFVLNWFLLCFSLIFRYIYPDFLPDPVYYFRDKIRERLERIDMINRRKQLNMPEFYVGKPLFFGRCLFWVCNWWIICETRIDHGCDRVGSVRAGQVEPFCWHLHSSRRLRFASHVHSEKHHRRTR